MSRFEKVWEKKERKKFNSAHIKIYSWKLLLIYLLAPIEKEKVKERVSYFNGLFVHNHFDLVLLPAQFVTIFLKNG